MSYGFTTAVSVSTAGGTGIVTIAATSMGRLSPCTLKATTLYT